MWFWGYSLPMNHLGHYFLEPGDYQDTPLSKILHFIQSVGLLRCWKWGGCTVDHWWSSCKDHPLSIHLFMWELSHFPKLYKHMREMSTDGPLILFKKREQHEMWLQVIVHMASKVIHLKFWHVSRKEKWQREEWNVFHHDKCEIHTFRPWKKLIYYDRTIKSKNNI
jgi:hypothetical protein